MSLKAMYSSVKSDNIAEKMSFKRLALPSDLPRKSNFLEKGRSFTREKQSTESMECNFY